jgi:hypothetical protein
MPIIVDDDLRTVAEYMQANVPAAKLVATADALSAVAPLLWGRYERQAVVPLGLTLGHDPHTRPSATERRPAEDAGGGSAAGAAGVG